MTIAEELKNAKAENELLKARIAEFEKAPKAEDAVAAATVTLNKELDKVRAELQEANNQLVELGKELDEAKAITDEKVAARALEITASQGNVPPIALKPAKNPQNDKQLSVLDQYNAITDSRERGRFYDEHRDELLK